MSDSLMKLTKENMSNVNKVKQVILEEYHELCHQILPSSYVIYKSCKTNFFLEICKKSSAKLMDENILQENYSLSSKHSFIFFSFNFKNLHF